MALVLACAKKIVHSSTHCDRRLSQFGHSASGEPPERSHGFQWMKIPGLEELSGLTMGIFGFGDIGNEVARRALAFGMRVIYHKRTPLPVDLEAELDVAYAPKDDLLRQADFLVLTSPLTPQTEKAIGRHRTLFFDEVNRLPSQRQPGRSHRRACPFAAALREHRLAGAGLDFFVQEPIPFDHPFLTLDNVTFTPHIAGGKGGLHQRQMLAVLENLARFARGEPCLHRIV